MANFLKRVAYATKVAVKSVGEDMKNHSYQINGEKLACPLCKHDEFSARSALLNTRGMTMVGMDWANQSATFLACKKCNYILPFLSTPEKFEGNTSK